MSLPAAAAPQHFPGRLYLAAGLAVAVLGIAAYVAQVASRRLVTPWYLPGAATLGVVLVALSLWQAPSVWRVLALVLVLLLAGAGWAFVVGARLPAYTGPVAEGKPFPAFTTLRADGSKFTQADLAGKSNSVMVFFRGRW
jgi:hypothetical protein